MPLVLTRATKEAARYTGMGGRERCSLCRFYLPQGTCARIVGPVSPMGWCRYFSQELVAQRYHPGATAMGGAAAPPAIDLSLLGPTLDPSITFARASIGTYFDVAGVMQTATSGTPRFDYDPVTHAMNGLLMESATTNLLLNSATLGTQSVAVTAQAYTLSFYGTGTITKSGTASGALVGTGAFPQRVSQTFTPTAGTLTLTVTGTVQNAQLETGAFLKSYVLTTGTTATRALETAYITSIPWFTAAASTLASEFLIAYAAPQAGTVPCSAELNDASTNNVYSLRIGAGVGVNVYSAGVAAIPTTNAGATTPGVVMKHAASFDAVGLVGNTTINGATVTPYTMTAVPVSITRLAVGLGRTTELNGWVRRIRYWPSVLPASQLQSITL